MNTLWRLAEAVMAKGATIIGGVQLRGMDTFPTLFGHFEGRPNQNDLAMAEQYGHAIAANIIDGLELPGHFRADQEKEGKKFPDFIAPILLYMKDKTIPIPECDLEKCILCGNCIYDCPTDNIKINKKAEKPKT
ncbi:MAG: hypothetical protein GY754_04480, partial [bacterium]|nr:hypothetical protein [bacterium]